MALHDRDARRGLARELAKQIARALSLASVIAQDHDLAGRGEHGELTDRLGDLFGKLRQRRQREDYSAIGVGTGGELVDVDDRMAPSGDGLHDPRRPDDAAAFAHPLKIAST